MAEYMARQLAGDDSGWIFSSAGTMCGDGLAASANAVAAMREVGIDMSGHRTRGITSAMLEQAEVIVAMTQQHADAILSVNSKVKEKVFLMRSFDQHADTRDVHDPVGWDIDVYRGTREMLDGSLSGLLEFLEQLEGE